MISPTSTKTSVNVRLSLLPIVYLIENVFTLVLLGGTEKKDLDHFQNTNIKPAHNTATDKAISFCRVDYLDKLVDTGSVLITTATNHRIEC